MVRYFIGVEGGGTHTSIAIVEESGKVLCECDDAPCSNIWELGVEKCAQLIIDQILILMKKANISSNSILSGIGLSLSGMETKRIQDELLDEIRKKSAIFSSVPFEICNDVQCAIQCGIQDGGVLLIAGTGTNCQVQNPDTDFHKFGGWGYMLGDQGSAYYIVNELIHKLILLSEGLCDPRFCTADISEVQRQLLSFYEISSLDGLLELYYKRFNRAVISSFCVQVMKLAESGNSLCIWIVNKAAKYLAKHIQGIYGKVDKRLFQSGPLKILCVGSLWKSYKLLQGCFLSQLNGLFLVGENCQLVRLKTSAAIGAAILGAKKASISISFDPSERTELLDLFP